MGRNYRRSRLLVPDAYDAMQKLKFEVAEELGRLEYCKENNDHYKGDLTARENGSQGGPIGGYMVNNICPVRTVFFTRNNRTLDGHVHKIGYEYRIVI